MAGSYSMARQAWSLIENMGDAHEAVEEMLWLIDSQIGLITAQRLIDTVYYPMCNGQTPEDDAMRRTNKTMNR